MKLTKAIIYAAALDAAKRDARKRGLAIIDDAANDVYHGEFNRLFAFVGGAEGWMDLQ